MNSSPSTQSWKEKVKTNPIERERMQRAMATESLHQFVKHAWKWVDPDPFIDGDHIKVLCHLLEQVTRGKITRLLINVPPRTAKSLIVSVLWPAWCWAQPARRFTNGKIVPLSGPRARFVSASYDGNLSTRDNLKMRNLISSPWYRSWFPHVQLADDQGQKTRFNTTANGFRQSTSVSGMATGEGGDALIIDDPHNVKHSESPAVREETVRWFREVLPSRLNNRELGAIVVVMQRVHERDISGYILSSGLPYTHLCLPALYEPDHPFRCEFDWRTESGQPLWPERPGFDRKGIDQLALEMGSYAAAGQLQQRPVPRGGGIFKGHWFDTIDALPVRRTKVRAWDLAASDATGSDPDWTVGVLMSRDAEGFFYVEDIVRMRGSPHEVERVIRSTAMLDGKDVIIRLPQDPGQAGKAQVAYMVRQLAGYAVKSYPVTGSKETRAGPLAAQAEAGNVKLLQAPWNRPFIEELCAFPTGSKDDQVDAAADAFNELAQPQRTVSVSSISWAAKR
jgi:predicted phage terminase large subunit-like protein